MKYKYICASAGTRKLKNMSVSLANWSNEEDADALASDSEYSDATSTVSDDEKYVFLDELTRLEETKDKKKVSDEYLCHQNNYLSYINHLLSDSNEEFKPDDCSPFVVVDEDKILTLEEQESLLAEGRLQYAINNDLPWEKKLSELDAYMKSTNKPKIKYVSEMLKKFKNENVERTLPRMNSWQNILNTCGEIWSSGKNEAVTLPSEIMAPLKIMLGQWDKKEAMKEASANVQLEVLVSEITESSEPNVDKHEEVVKLYKKSSANEELLHKALQKADTNLNLMKLEDVERLSAAYFTITTEKTENTKLIRKIHSELLKRNGGPTRVVVRFRSDDTTDEKINSLGLTKLDFMQEELPEASCNFGRCGVRGTVLYTDKDGIETIGTKYRYNDVRKTSEGQIPFTLLQAGLIDNNTPGAIFEVFKPEASQQEIYRYFDHFLLNATDEKSVCLAFYGGSGSGKTYTAIGDEHQIYPGVVPRLINRLNSNTDNRISIRCVEILGNKDLKSRDTIVLRSLPTRKEFKIETLYKDTNEKWQNIDAYEANNVDEALSFFKKCQAARLTANNGIHENSSRGHMIFQITVTRNEKESYVYVCDLAGKENISDYTKDLAVNKKGMLDAQSKLINDSLDGFIREYRNKKKTKTFTGPKSLDTTSSLVLVLKPVFANKKACLALMVCLYPVLVQGPAALLSSSNTLVEEKQEQDRRKIHSVGGIFSRIKANDYVLRSLTS
jgi:ribosomal protein L17